MFFLQGLQSAYFFWFTGCKNKNHGALLKELMQTSNFRVTVVEEYDVVEICGALKVSSQCRICLLATRLQNMDSHLDFNTGLFMVSRTNDYFCTLSKSHTKQSRGILSLVPVFFFSPHRVPVSHAWDYKVKWHSTCESHKKHVPHKDMLIYGHVSTETESWWSHRTDNNRFKRFRLKIKHQHLFLLKPKNVFFSCRVCVFGCVTIADSLSQHY